MEEKINQFYTWVDKHPRKKGQVRVSRHFLRFPLLRVSCQSM